MTNQVNQYERHMAIQEAYQIHDSDEYFKARPQLECGDRRKVFYAGHIRGYQAATQASEQRITELQELLNDRQSDLDFEFNRAEQNELDCNALKERVAELEADLELLKPHPKCDMGCMLSCNTEGNAIRELQADNNQLRKELENTLTSLQEINDKYEIQK